MNKNFDKFINAGKYIGAATLGIAGNTAVLNYFGDTTIAIQSVAGLSGGLVGATAGYIAGSAIGSSIGFIAKNKKEIKTDKFIMAGVACVSTALIASNNISPNLTFLVCLYSFAKINTLASFLLEKTIEKTEDVIVGISKFGLNKTKSMIEKIRKDSNLNILDNKKLNILK